VNHVIISLISIYLFIIFVSFIDSFICNFWYYSEWPRQKSARWSFRA